MAVAGIHKYYQHKMYASEGPFHIPLIFLYGKLLNALKDTLFDEVKIDKRFLSDELSENGKIVLQEIFHLLKRTNKSIVCEGVETKEMVDFLVEEGCDELQGYYYYKPMSQNAFEKLLENIA